jgi:hypothetical protein
MTGLANPWHRLRARRSRCTAPRSSERGTSLVEAMVAFALVTLSAMALLRIQAVWMLAGHEAAHQMQSTRDLQTAVDAAIATPASSLPITPPVSPSPNRSVADWVLERTSGGHAGEWSAAWHGGWSRRDGSLRAWTVHGHLYPVPVVAWTVAEQARRDAAAGRTRASNVLAPGGRPPAWDASFDEAAGHSGHPTPSDASSARDASGAPVHVDAGPRVEGRQPVCTGRSAGRLARNPPPATCDERQPQSRSGAIRWHADALADRAVRAVLEDWVAGLIEPPSADSLAGEAAPSNPQDPRCEFRLEPGADPHLAWRCLGRAWSDAEPTSTAEWPSGMASPLGRLPSGLRACRYADESGVQTPRHQGLAVLQHQRVHWLVIPAAHECPQGTVPHRP